jgi:HAD superfamily hydrolase (TIGR01548 family)
VATAARFGVFVDPADIADAKARGDASDDWELTRRLCATAGVDVGLDEVRECFETLYQGVEGMGGLKEEERLTVDTSLLEEWAGRFPLAIVTARPRKDAIEFCDRFGIGGLFETIVTREDSPPKPDPAPVRLAMERLGVDRAWMVGDTVDDLMAARAAGVVPIAVATPGEERGHLGLAARVLTCVDEIEEVLREAFG